MTSDVDRLADLLRGRRTLVLTGAGISTDSGIPDYRGSGIDRRRKPRITYREFMRDPVARRRYWARSHVGLPFVQRARPNQGHQIVTALQGAGLVSGIITQNVDGLHQKAGAVDVLDLHGRLDRVICTSCTDIRPRVEIGLRLSAVNADFEAAAVELAPDGDAELPEELLTSFKIVDCRRCGGLLKPDVVFFGESMPPARRERASSQLAASDTLMVLGSSLAVMSGYRLVLQAAKAGQHVAIVTRGGSRGDPHATVRVDADLSSTLAELLDELDVDLTASGVRQSG